MEEVKFQNLGSRAFIIFLFKRIGPAFFFFVLAGVVMAVEFLAVNMPIVTRYHDLIEAAIYTLLMLAALAAVAGTFIAYLEFHRFKIKLDDDSFWIRRGILTLHKISIPYPRIERVNIRQPLIFQMLKISQMTIELTYDFDQGQAKTDDEFIPAMDAELAQHIQTQLTDRVSRQKMHIHKNTDVE